MRKARKLAAARQQAWDEIRASQELDRESVQHGTARATVPGTRRPPLITGTVGDGATPDAHVRAVVGTEPSTQFETENRGARRGVPTTFSVLHPIAGAFALVLLLVAGTPLVDGTWSLPWLIGSIVGALVLLVLYPRATRGAGTGAQITGLGLGLLVVIAGIAGIAVQNVVDGRAQLRGSEIDRAVEEHRELVLTLEVLTENQGLLTLPPEQAIPLGSVYAEARQQAITIGERWNPATKPTPPLPELAPAYELVNMAAAQQAAALDGFVANLENPEPAVEAEYIERGLAIDALLQREIPRALDTVDRAVRDAVTKGADR